MKLTRILPALAGGLAGCAPALLALERVAALAADDGDNLPCVIPYQGRIERDGALYNGDVELRFTIEVMDGDGSPWVEEWSESAGTGAVTVYGGQFSVLVGTRTTPDELLLETTNSFGSGTERFTAHTAGDTWFAGDATFPSTVTVTGDVNSDGGLTLEGGQVSLGSGATSTKYIAFKDSNPDEGMQLRYNPSADVLTWEQEASMSNQDNLVLVHNDGDVFLYGDVSIGNELVTNRDDYTREKEIEGDVDKISLY